MIQRTLLALLLALALLPAARAQDSDPTPTPPPVEAVPPSLSVAQIDSRIATLDQSELDEAQRAAALESYTKAKGLVQASQAALTRRTEFEQAAAEAPNNLEAIRQELAKPPGDPVLNVTGDASVDMLERGLADAVAARNTAEDRLNDLRNTLKQRDSRRGDLAQLIAAANESQREASEALDALPDDGPTALRLAQRTLLQAQLLQAQSERDSLISEQESYKARAELLPARLDLARRRLSQLEVLVAAWRERAGAARRAEAERATEEARRFRQQEAAQRVPSLRVLAASYEQLALERSDPSGLAAQIQEATESLAQTRDQLARLRDRFLTVRRKIEAAGLSNAMARLLRREYERLPNVEQIERRQALFAQRVSETQLRLIELEEEREDAGDVEAALLQVLSDPSIKRESLDPSDVEFAARQILTARKETIGVLVREYTNYLLQLLDIGLIERELSAATKAYRAYIEERILWVRSVTGSALPNPVQAADAAGWLFSLSRARRALGRGLSFMQESPLELILFALILLATVVGAIVSTRRWGKGSGISFARTLRGLVKTLAIAIPGPLAMLGLAWLLLAPPDQTEWGLAVGSGLEQVALLGFYLFTVWLLAAPSGGLAVQQFHWKPEAVSHLRRHLAWFGPLAAAAIFISVSLDQQEVVARTESLGRGAFVIGEIGLAILAHLWFRKGSPLFAGSKGVSARLRWLNHVVLCVGPVILAFISLWGYYYTALRLTRSLEQSLVLIGVLVLVRAMFLRWFLIARRRLAREQAERRAQSTTQSRSGIPADPSQSTSGSDKPEVLPEDELDLASIKNQIDQLVRGALAVAAVAGLLWIWADVLPALRRLEQVQLYPEIAITEAKAVVLPSVLTGAKPDAAQPEATHGNGNGNGGAKTEASGEGPSLPSMTPGMPAPSEGAAPSTAFGTLTLADLLLSFLIVMITVAASKNVPALFEVALLQHLPVDAGARYALITIARYAIVVIGMWSAAGAIGITWSSIQWLAAALTFGLAFGLQEIFANFVSGMIIFGERPVKVGDIVTVGAVTGRVSRIRIRAITIVDFDRKELIVPNREFVTGHVINWTLTDNILRVIIPVGVAYGTDAKRVRDLLLDVATRSKLVLDDPAPNALFMNFGASSLDFELRVFVAGIDTMLEIRSVLLQQIQARLRDEGIEVPFPQRDLNIRTGPVIEKLLAAGHLQAVNAAEARAAASPDETPATVPAFGAKRGDDA